MTKQNFTFAKKVVHTTNDGENSSYLNTKDFNLKKQIEIG